MSKLPARILRQLRPFRRDAYTPQTEPAASEHNERDKFGGLPYLRAIDDWPTCSNCGKPTQLFIQLDRARLPAQTSRGLVQLFYCVNGEPHCEVDCAAWHPNRTSTCLRVIDAAGPSAIAPSAMAPAFPERRIVGWTRVDDYPGRTECVQLGGKLTQADGDEISAAGYPLRGDKLFGWPDWMQGVEYHLPVSSLFVQLTAFGNLPHSFGGGGCGHLTRSDRRPDEMAFGWAC